MEGLISGGAYKRYLIVPNFAAYDNMSGLFGLTANILATRTRVQVLVVVQNKPTMPPFYDGLYTRNFVMPSWKAQADFLNSFLKFESLSSLPAPVGA